MKCHNCGFDNEEEAKFCQKCGDELHEKNKASISETLEVSHFDISGIDIKEIHPANI